MGPARRGGDRVVSARGGHAAGPDGRPGALERLTHATPFAILFGISVTFGAMLLLAGIVAIPSVLLDAGRFAVAWLLLVAGGIAGLSGFLVSRCPVPGRARVELGTVLLSIGIVAAAAVAGPICAWLVFRPPSDMTVGAGLFVAAPHLVLVVAGLGSIQRLQRRYVSVRGERFDVLPVVFLLVALGLGAAFALVIASGLPA